VGLVTRKQSEGALQEYFDELAFLAATAGATTVARFYQQVDTPNPATYVGKGKLDEIRQYVQSRDIDLVIFDDEITASQQRNIEKELRCKILDRSMLILDIFAKRARTQQAKTQVELAQMQYLLPRLKGMWTHLDRVKGGIGMRGAGEKEIETDRRVALKTISNLKAQLKKIDSQNAIRRKSREEMIRVALVGYTNVGKSTIMNLLSKSDVFAENKLFATLDTTVRKVVIDRTPFLLSDTVGFIRKLPHHLVESFKSTLDEVVESDLLIHVVDVSHPQFEAQMEVVNDTLLELQAANKPTITVFNKMDLYERHTFDRWLDDDTKADLLAEMTHSWMAKHPGAVFISATEKHNTDALRQILLEEVKTLYRVRYPYRTEFY
jgi:GTP-binding protein HflX